MLNDAKNERKEDGISVGKAIGGMFAKAYGIGNSVVKLIINANN